MDPIVVHAGDDLPNLYLRLYDQDNTEYMDLTSAAVQVYAKFRRKGSSTVLQSFGLSKVALGAGGRVMLTWPDDSFDVDAGRYEVEIYLTCNGKVWTANKYYMSGEANDSDTVLEFKIVGDF